MKKLIVTVISVVFAIVLLLTSALAVFYIMPGYKAYKTAVAEVPIEEMIQSVREKENYTTLDEIPQIYKNAVIAVEDHRFYKHGAFSVTSIMRAVLVNIRSRKAVEGGSTITQQVAKNLYFEMDKTLTRKFSELFVAIELEKKCSKDEILEIYINSIYYGSGYYSIYDASMGYFGVEPKDLNDYQATLLAGLPNAPSVYSINNNTPLTYQRQRQVINAMVEYGYLTQNKANEILNDK